ncbi:MAG: hypothetical protein MZV70_18425 [Desulfobacterales bacterium]|nr:hypothetical protein [Desulfobacterales bacterium]
MWTMLRRSRAMRRWRFDRIRGSHSVSAASDSGLEQGRDEAHEHSQRQDEEDEGNEEQADVTVRSSGRSPRRTRPGWPGPPCRAGGRRCRR